MSTLLGLTLLVSGLTLRRHCSFGRQAHLVSESEMGGGFEPVCLLTFGVMGRGLGTQFVSSST